MALKGILSKRFPTILGLLLLLLSVGAGVFLVSKEQLFSLKAAPELTPRKLRISNISDNSFTVSWVTDAATSGFLRYGESSDLNLTTADERDQLTGETSSYLTHYFTVRNLKSATVYYFKLGSGNSRTLFDNNGQPYEAKTAPLVSVSGPLPSVDLTSGTVISSTGLPVEGAIVYLSVDRSKLLSARTLENGNWTLSLNQARTADLSDYLIYDPESSLVSIEVEGGKEVATAVVNTGDDNPVPTITLGQNKDFRETTLLEEEKAKPASPSAQTSFADLPEPTEVEGPPVATESTALTILNPSQEGESLNTTKPEFSGKAPPGVVISIKVESATVYTGSVTVDEEGDWQWSPPVDLEPGTHKVTFSYIDETGKEKTMSRSFVVLAAGENELPAFEATPSGESTASARPSPSPEPRVSLPSTEGGIPQPGVLTPTFFFFIMGLSLLLGGSILRFFKNFKL